MNEKNYIITKRAMEELKSRRFTNVYRSYVDELNTILLVKDEFSAHPNKNIFCSQEEITTDLRNLIINNKKSMKGLELHGFAKFVSDNHLTKKN